MNKARWLCVSVPSPWQQRLVGVFTAGRGRGLRGGRREGRRAVDLTVLRTFATVHHAGSFTSGPPAAATDGTARLLRNGRGHPGGLSAGHHDLVISTARTGTPALPHIARAHERRAAMGAAADCG
nr:hypothetical protein StreXyl84_32750 [Streptomyces sp. Xyl84]